MAQRVGDRHPGVTWWCPQLPPSPAQAMAEILAGVSRWPTAQMAVVGSSLGGFYARYLSQRLGCRAVLLNPAVYPARDLSRHIGEQTAWHNPDERFFFEPAYVEELQRLENELLHMDTRRRPDHDQQMAIIAKGDEVLDWREMQAFCQGGQVQLLEGSDHALSAFDERMDAVFAFLDLAD